MQKYITGEKKHGSWIIADITQLLPKTEEMDLYHINKDESLERQKISWSLL